MTDFVDADTKRAMYLGSLTRGRARAEMTEALGRNGMKQIVEQLLAVLEAHGVGTPESAEIPDQVARLMELVVEQARTTGAMEMVLQLDAESRKRSGRGLDISLLEAVHRAPNLPSLERQL